MTESYLPIHCITYNLLSSSQRADNCGSMLGTFRLIIGCPAQVAALNILSTRNDFLQTPDVLC